MDETTSRAAETLWCRLPGRGLIEVSGDDRVRWLNGMLSNEIGRLAPPGNGCRALLLSRQGRVLADIHVLLWPESIWLDLEGDFVASTMEQLGSFIIADDAVLTDRSTEWIHISVEGPDAAGVLSRVGGREPQARHGAVRVALSGIDCAVADYAFGPHGGVQLFVPSSDIEALEEAVLSGPGAPRPADPEALEILRVEAGTPRMGCDLDESVLPDEARLSDAVSTTKGCYTGQEVIARLRSRGRIKNLLVGLRFDTPVPAGAKLGDAEDPVGEVTSAVSSPRFGPIGLGYVRTERSEPGTRLRTDEGVAEVVALPFLHDSA